MKPFYLIFIYAFFCISCDFSEVAPSVRMYNSENDHIKINSLPYNASNEFDEVGAVYAMVFDSYFGLPELPTALDSVLVLVNLQMSKNYYFELLPDFDYHYYSSVHIQNIISNPDLNFSHALDASILTSYARVSFENFIHDLFVKIKDDVDYIYIYDYIVAFESALAEDSLYTSEEKAFLYTITSIARHGIFSKEKKPKKNYDPDWDWLTTSIVGSVYGATHSAPMAISTALKTGLGK